MTAGDDDGVAGGDGAGPGHDDGEGGTLAPGPLSRQVYCLHSGPSHSSHVVQPRPNHRHGRLLASLLGLAVTGPLQEEAVDPGVVERLDLPCER